MSYAQPARRTATLGATSTNSWRALLLLLALLLTTACGGGGGDGGGHGSASSAAALNRYGPVLEPDAPLRTSAESYILSGEVNAEYTRGDNCESDGPSQETIMRLRWRNTTTGANGTSDVILACRPSGTIVGPYVFHVWSTGPVQLALGDNVFELDTYDDGQQIGSQRVTVLRHDGIAPTVAYRYPVDGAVDVPTNHVIQVQFSEAMDPSSLLDANLTLLDASANPLTGTYEYNATHRTWTLQPTSLLTPGETYRVTLSGSLRDAYGIEMAGDLVWHFTAGASADTTAPVLLARRPENTCYCDPGAVVLSATFGEPLDPDSVTAETFFVTDDVGEEVSGSIEVSGDRIEFRPAADYIHGRVYQATVAAGVRDANGYATNGQASWSFRFDPQQPFGAWQEAWRSEQPTYGVTSVWDGMEFHFWGETSGPYKDPSECAADDAACQDEFVTRALGRSFNGIDTTITGIADSPLRHPSLVWTGREVLRYGGSDAAGPVARSQRFDPMVGAWENTSGYWPEDGVHYFLKGLVNHSAIWTGSEMIVWGGSRRLDGVTNRGWRYDPARDQWSITGPLPSIDASLRLIEDPNAPTARQHHAAAWTGTEMFIFGGRDGGVKPLRDAAAYNPAT
ncbi:MAG: Ig-like domain-containing protein, partial [Gammaproteobacteria bacterium]